MATEQKGHVVSIPASGDLSANQYRLVSVDSNGQIALTGDGAQADGVLQDKPAAAGRPGQVMVGNGITKAEAGGTVTAGGPIASDSTGRVVDTVTGDVICGTAMEAATAAGQIISVLFQAQRATA